MKLNSTFLILMTAAVLSVSCLSVYASNYDEGPGYSQPMGGANDDKANQGSSIHVPYPPSNNTTKQYPIPPSYGTGCGMPEVSQAQSELASAEQNYQKLKTNYYQNWKQLSALGKYNGSWDQYAKEQFLNSTEVGKIRQIHEKYGGFVQYCYPAPQSGRSSPIVLPVTSGGTTGGTISNPFNGTGTVAPSKSMDVLMELEPSPSIPVWIKNNAQWWATGQISDSDFTSGISYLASHKIIQLYPSASTDNNTGSALPPWVKGLAGSWANGSVSNEYFVTTIQYLADQKIIQMP